MKYIKKPWLISQGFFCDVIDDDKLERTHHPDAARTGITTEAASDTLVGVHDIAVFFALQFFSGNGLGRTDGLAEMAVATGAAAQATFCFRCLGRPGARLWSIMGCGQAGLGDKLLAKVMPILTFESGQDGFRGFLARP